MTTPSSADTIKIDLVDQSTIQSSRSSTTPRKNDDNVSITTTTKYPHIVDATPFPALGSVNEISRIITRESITQKEDGANQEKGTKLNPWEVPLETEGWRNPGWMSVAGSFLVNFVVFGNTFSWGNFQRLYLQEIYTGQTDEFSIAFIGTIANSVLLSFGVFLTPLIQRIGFRATMAIGAIIYPLGLILASFTNSLWQLYITQGLMIGIGGAFVFSPSLTLPSQWFTKNRGLATGIAASGSGIGGVALSPMTERLIGNIGYRMALRVLGATSFGILVIAVALAQSRYRPPPGASGLSSGLSAFWDKSMFSWPFSLLSLFSFLVPFGYIGPFFLAPTYVSHLGGTPAQGSTLISIMSGMSAICRITLGFFADRTGRLNTMFACTFLAGVFTMIVWQVSTSYNVFVAYCVLYGLTAGGFVSLFPVVTAEVVGVQHIQKALGLSYFITLFGNLVGSPLIGLLQKERGWTAAIQFTGAPSVVAGIIMLVLRFMLNKKVLARV